MYQLAHRGYSDAYPENTIPAFKAALSGGFDGIETDVQMTLDGELVLCHDYKINRTSTGKGFLRDYTYLELLQYNFCGKHKMKVSIPTLDELLTLYHDSDKILNLEIKEDVLEGIERKVAQRVKEHHLEKQVFFSSTSSDSMLRMKRFLPESYCALIVSDHYKHRKMEPIYYHLDGIHVKYDKLNERELSFFKEHHIEVGAWTIKKEKDFAFFKKHDILFVFTNRLME